MSDPLVEYRVEGRAARLTLNSPHNRNALSRQLLEELCAATNVPLTTRGGVTHLSDLHLLHEFVPLGVDAIVIDDGLYDGDFTFSEAVAASADRFDVFFWGTPS